MMKKIGVLLTILCLIASVIIMPTTSNAAGSLIPDDNLRKAINEQLVDDGATGIDVDTHEPTEAELEGLTTLFPTNKGVISLEGLEKASNLLVLGLRDNNITDISPLSGLSKLYSLNIENNNLTDISPLSGLNDLTILELPDNNITDISPLSGLNNLMQLRFVSNNITDVSPLSGLNKLTSVNLESNNITDVSPFSGLNDLKVLGLSDNNITDISPLSGLNNLMQLQLDSNNITDVSPFSGLNNLQQLQLASNNITDVSPLESIKNSGTIIWGTNQEITLDEISLLPNSGLSIENPIIDFDGSKIAPVASSYNGSYSAPEITWTGLQGIETEVTFKYITYNKDSEERISGEVIQPIKWIEPNEAPIIDATDQTIQVGDTFDELDGVTATDAEDGDLTAEITVTKNEVDTTTAGDYEVTYEVTDSAGETTTKTITVTVEAAPNEAPVIDATDQTLQVGDTFDELDGVTATDGEDGDLTDEITVTKNEVDTTTAGDYEVTYEVTDSDGETTTKTIKITVEEANTNPPTEPEVTQVQVVPGVTVDKGTAKNDVGLPTEVRIELDNGDQPIVDVIWDEGTPKYDQDVVGKYEFVGSLVLPDGVNNVAGIKARTVVKVDGEITEPTEPTDPTEPTEPTEPTDPEDPENIDSSEDESGKVTIDSEDDDSDKVNITSEDDPPKENDTILPKTATTFYNLLFIGILLIAVGAGIFIWKRRTKMDI